MVASFPCLVGYPLDFEKLALQRGNRDDLDVLLKVLLSHTLKPLKEHFSSPGTVDLNVELDRRVVEIEGAD